MDLIQKCFTISGKSNVEQGERDFSMHANNKTGKRTGRKKQNTILKKNKTIFKSDYSLIMFFVCLFCLIFMSFG